MQKPYQEHPRLKSTFTNSVNRSPTDSLESYQNKAWKETVILRRNNRIPTKAFVVRLYRECSVKKIGTYRKQIFRYLRDRNFEGVVSIELTRGADGLPNNRVHFHLITDDGRDEVELRELLNRACERSGLVKRKDFGIVCYELPDGFGYFDYFTKFGKRYADKVTLFRNEKELGARINKFYRLGSWFGEYKDGEWVKQTKEQIWREYICERYNNK